MSKRIKNFLKAISLLALIASFIPFHQAAFAAPSLPPVDMFQLPWEQGLAWVALDGFDDGSYRHSGSPHNYLNGGAVDFAPRANMIKGENTSAFWVTAAAAGKVVEISKCHMKIAHANGWISEYQHLATLQVKLGDTVARNQKLAVIANASTQPVCPGSEPPDIPHLHFTVRPNMIGATFAGWEFHYDSFWNTTTFRKGGQTVGLLKPLLNVLDQPTPTLTPTLATTFTPDAAQTTLTAIAQQTNTAIAQITSTFVAQQTNTALAQMTSTAMAQATLTASAQQTGTPTISSTATPFVSPTTTPPLGPYVLTSVNPLGIAVGESALVNVILNNVPSDGFTSAEFLCTYDGNLAEAGDISFSNLFGPDPATVVTDLQNGSFIAAIAGASGNKATTSGLVFTFNLNALQAGQTQIKCEARVSKGDGVLTTLPRIDSVLTIVGLTPTLTFTPTPSSAICDRVEFIADMTVPHGTVFLPGAGFTKTWRLKNAGACAWTREYQMTFYSGNPMGAPSAINFAMDVAPGETVDVSLDMIAPSVAGPYRGYWIFKNASGALFGIGAQANEPWFVDITVSGPTFTPIGITATPTPAFTATAMATATLPPGALITGQVNAPKVVTIRLLDSNETSIASINTNPGETFSFNVPAGSYILVATANGYLRIQGSVTVAAGETHTMPTITLLAGDIDDNNVIDQFDALTIGFGYGSNHPPGADLNDDGVINVLDLELLAKNYRAIGPILWQ